MWRNSSIGIIWNVLWRYSKGHHVFLISLITLLIIGNLVELISPYATGQIINSLQVNGKNGVPDAFFWVIALGASQVISIILNNIGLVLDKKLSRIVSHNFLKDFYKKTQSLPLLWHQDHHSGDLVSRLNKANSAAGIFVNAPTQMIWMVIGFFGPALILLKIMPVIGMFAVFISISASIISLIFDKKIKKYSRISNGFYHKVIAAMNDYLGNIRTIIILHLGLQTREDISNRLKLTIEPFNKEIKFKLWRWASTESIIEIMIVVCLVYILLAFRREDENIQIGNIVIAINYLRQMAMSVYRYTGFHSNLVQAVTDFESFDLIDQAYDEHMKIHKDVEFDINKWSEISVRNLSFIYSAEQEIAALNNLSFTFKSGEKIALVGVSGAGKSTLMSVLRNLYPVQRGTTDIDGTIYPNIDPLASISTLIPQDPEIFENTIRYNITLGVEHSDAEIMEACRIACFNTVIDELPNGLDSKINEKGVNLSGGQKQRLALARGIFAIQNSSLVLFDEPTSSVDSMTERLMYKNLFAAFPDICLISSIHRLNLLNQFDTIWVMQKGKLVQQGSLTELLKQPDQPFYHLWNAYQAEENA